MGIVFDFRSMLKIVCDHVEKIVREYLCMWVLCGKVSYSVGIWGNTFITCEYVGKWSDSM